MKPKNKFQQQVFELSQKLPKITDVQQKWAFQHCIDHYGKRNAKGVITCLECANNWRGNSELSDITLGANCPQCSTKLEILNTKKRVFKQCAYFCIVTTKADFQVLRFFIIKYEARVGEKAHYFLSEIVQRWIAPNGKSATIARTKTMSYYSDDLWNFNNELEIRNEKEHHHISPTAVYPRQRVIPELKTRGYKGDNGGISHFNLFRTLLTESRAETLFKAGQTEILRHFIGYFQLIDSYWASIKICMRNNYYIPDANSWCDYVGFLRFFGKDLHNAKFVCPNDLNAEHDRYMKKKREHQERERREKKRQQAFEQEAKFYEMKSKFFGIEITNGTIQVRVLESVEEIMQEGDAMRHCVFASDYHLRPHSLILSACVNGVPMETVEFSLSKMKVVQCRGLHNKNTEYHDQIIELVNKNKRLIKRRMAA